MTSKMFENTYIKRFACFLSMLGDFNAGSHEQNDIDSLDGLKQHDLLSLLFHL